MGCFIDKVNKSFYINLVEVRHPWFKDEQKTFCEYHPIKWSYPVYLSAPNLVYEIKDRQNNFPTNMRLASKCW